jgi:hypothetical protein
MQSIPFRNLRNITPSTLRKKLAHTGELLLTVNNSPVAMMIGLDNENAQDIMQLVFRFRAQMAVSSIRSQARKDRLNKISLKEVNAVISRTRMERRY